MGAVNSLSEVRGGSQAEKAFYVHFPAQKTHPVAVFCLLLCNANNRIGRKRQNCCDNSSSSYTVKICHATLRFAHVVHEVRLLQPTNILSRSVKLHGIRHFRIKMAYLLINIEKRAS